jgi:CRISPR system Cascade subunit CasA
MSDFSYNLIDEPWITCTSRDGTRSVGLRELLLSAHELRGIESPNPLFVAALIRVLLAMVHRIADGPRRARDWGSLYSAGRFSEEQVNAYLRRVHDRFDLFSDTHPFYQTAGLSIIDANSKEAPVSAAVIMHERASGNNKTIFDHTTDDSPLALSPAMAARALLTTQMFALGGLNKKSTNHFGFQQSYLNAAMVSGIFIGLTGASLFETLMLNLLLPEFQRMGSNPADKPVWERDDRGQDKAKVPTGYLDFLTCKCRHIRLLPEQNNDRITVSKLHIAQGEAFQEVANPAFMRKKNNKTGEWYCPQLNPDRLVWRDSASLFAFDQGGVDERPAAFRQAVSLYREVPFSSRYHCMAIALANDKANPLAWRAESLPVPFALLENKETVNTLISGMDRAENVVRILDEAVKKFMRRALPPNSKDVNEKTVATGALRFYWDRLECHFNTFIAAIDLGDPSLLAWYGNIASVAHDALKSCVRQRYADSAATLRGWAEAVDELNRKLAVLNAKQGGGKQ